jgi:hypothetical protein
MADLLTTVVDAFWCSAARIVDPFATFTPLTFGQNTKFVVLAADE